MWIDYTGEIRSDAFDKHSLWVELSIGKKDEHVTLAWARDEVLTFII
jgi:hypothetical protein